MPAAFPLAAARIDGETVGLQENNNGHQFRIRQDVPPDVAPEGHVMNGDKELDHEQIEEAFRIMGQYLLDRNAPGEVALHGGSAILSFPRAA
jgi:hypothetical protein